jgi:hypothetical protein
VNRENDNKPYDLGAPCFFWFSHGQSLSAGISLCPALSGKYPYDWYPIDILLSYYWICLSGLSKVFPQVFLTSGYSWRQDGLILRPQKFGTWKWCRKGSPQHMGQSLGPATCGTRACNDTITCDFASNPDPQAGLYNQLPFTRGTLKQWQHNETQLNFVLLNGCHEKFANHTHSNIQRRLELLRKLELPF